MVTTEAVDTKLVTKLDAMHTAFGEHNPEWGKRIDIAYISKEDLSSLKKMASNVAVSGNAEPLELVKAPEYYLIDWYKTQKHGVILCGPPPSTLIPHISKEEFTAAIRGYMALGWPDRVAEAKTHSAQAYIVLTMCRCLYALSRGQHASKKLGAQWVKTQYPQWHELIDNALSWSRKKETDEVSSTVSQEQTSQFVAFALLKAKD